MAKNLGYMTDLNKDQAGNIALEMRSISKAFPGVQALSDVSFSLTYGSIHAIVGENGAGKSTLMKILSGVYQPSSGIIAIEGEEVSLRKPADAQERGIYMVYQELNLAPDLTVAENIFLGRMPGRFTMVQRKKMRRDAERILSDLGANIECDRLVGDLPIGQQQLVEIAKAYSASPQIIVLDEPTSSLSEHEAEALFAVLHKMKNRGIAVVYISHRLNEVLSISDHVTVLRDGTLAGSEPAGGMTTERMIQLMVGRDVGDIFPKIESRIGDLVFEAKNLGDGMSFDGVSFEVHAGEILGLTGLVGAGRTEVAQAIFGLRPLIEGEIRLKGQNFVPADVATSVARGIAYVSEDRKGEGIVPSMRVRENISLSVLKRLVQFGRVSAIKEKDLAGAYTKTFDIMPPDPERRIDLLSGGNQQKAVISKWLATEPSLLILDEPTRGVDVGAKSEIHRIIGGLAAQGIAVILISSELPEVMGVSDRIIAMHEGRSSPSIDRAHFNEEVIMAHATGEAVT